MQQYTYKPPKFKPSVKLIDVFDQQGNVVCKFKRTYKNILTRIVTYIWDIDWHVRFDVYNNDGKIVYQCIKKTKWFGRPTYKVMNCVTNEEYEVSYISWQKVAPKFLITNNLNTYIVKQELMDWARFYDQGKEVARWKIKATKFFKTYLEIDEDCPIQDREFFVCLFQNIFYVGD